jgi:WD40 repeat protein
VHMNMLLQVVKLWNIEIGECKLTYDKANSGFTSCGWFLYGKRFVSHGVDKWIYICDLEGKELDSWEGQGMPKISDLDVTSDGKEIISICWNNVIVMYNLETKTERLIEEESGITYLCVSKGNRYLLLKPCKSRYTPLGYWTSFKVVVKVQISQARSLYCRGY